MVLVRRTLAESAEDNAELFAKIRTDISRDGFAFRSGEEMRKFMRPRGLYDWPAFAASWDDLGIDIYMADGGRYRRRRFAAFSAGAGIVVRKPHQPHYQSRDYNPLNGGIERWFMPVSESVASNAFTQGLIGFALLSSTSSRTGSPRRRGMSRYTNSASRRRQVAPVYRHLKGRIAMASIGFA